MLKLPPLSLYIHIPWCIKKCFYCDFHSLELKNQVLWYDYVTNLINDFKNDIKLVNNRKIISIFIGGGSPSLLDIKSLKLLLDYIKQNYYLASDVEISIEVNSSELDFLKIQEYKNIGINRISIGIQSFFKKNLVFLDRSHSVEDALRISVIISSLKFNSFNFDIMYGLPNQQYYNAIDDLKTTIWFLTPHISWYQLTLDTKQLSDNNLLHSNKLYDEDIIYKINDIGNKLLNKHGYEHYEICSYAKFNNKCMHNINYWRFGDYIGIGSGAYGKISFKNGKILRTIKTKYLHDYMSGKYLFKKCFINKKNKILDFFINRFRLFEPIPKKEFICYTGLSISCIESSIDLALKHNYLFETNEHWITTNKGRLFYNDLLNIFIDKIQ